MIRSINRNWHSIKTRLKTIITAKTVKFIQISEVKNEFIQPDAHSSYSKELKDQLIKI